MVEPACCAGSATRTLVKIPAPLERARRCLHLSSLLSHISRHALRHRQSMQKPACWRRLRHSDSAIAASSCRTLVEASCPLERARRPVSFSSLFLHISRHALRHRQSMQKPACWRRLRHSDFAALRPHVGRWSSPHVCSSELGSRLSFPRCFCIFGKPMTRITHSEAKKLETPKAKAIAGSIA